jgi:hypothetical protein
LQCFEILLDLGPLKAMAGLLQAPIKFFAHHQSQKAAKDMAPDGAVMTVEKVSVEKVSNLDY